MAHIEEQSGRPKIFTSTNESNKPMQSLLKKRGFELSGHVVGLDEGDPEVIFMKKLDKTG